MSAGEETMVEILGMKRGIWPNTSFQRTLTRGGFGPLNSDR